MVAHEKQKERFVSTVFSPVDSTTSSERQQGEEQAFATTTTARFVAGMNAALKPNSDPGAVAFQLAFTIAGFMQIQAHQTSGQSLTLEQTAGSIDSPIKRQKI